MKTFYAAAAAITLALAACAGSPDKFGIESPGIDFGFPVKADYFTANAATIPGYCASIGGRLYDHGRACVTTGYSLARDDSGWCSMTVAGTVDGAELASVRRYGWAVCAGWHPLGAP